ncbi:MAG: hypothetical protein JWM18_4404 [Chloroflexi bacterium]|jgi:hypothetical protein|nr:hypothetical protein [Chloroflexota bacterium]
MRRGRRTAGRLALAALLTAVPLGSTTVGAGVVHAVPVAAATVQPLQVGVADAPTAQHRGDLDRGGDRHGHRRHDCGRHGGIVPLVVHLLFGFDRHC